jgi:ABC-type Fe3+/spermidine/putrescine transport system ATPase subunit
MSPYLRIEQLQKNWPGFALKVSLEIGRGEFVSILGPSGSGKTSLLRLVAGLEFPDSGQVFMAGQDISFVSPEKRGIGFVFQDLALFPHLNVFGNVAYGLRAGGISGQDLVKRVDLALNEVNLPGFAERKIQTLSGGERQRVSLARSLAPRPSLLLLDEPFSSLDAPLRKRMATDLRSLVKGNGVTTIHVTHDQAEAFEQSDRILVMNKGKIEISGSPAALRSVIQNEFVQDFLSADR